MIRYLTGDAADPPERPATIVHIVNDQGYWGRGFTAALDRRWPAAGPFYRAWTARALGRWQLQVLAPDVHLVHLCAQAGLRSTTNPVPLRYTALAHALPGLAALPYPLHMPRIGCGLAQGSWLVVEALLRTRLPATDVCVYDLPVTPRPE